MNIRSVWLNLPVSDVIKSRKFFGAIGFTENPLHKNAKHLASFLIGENNFVLMLFPNETFKNFTQHDIGDTKKSTEVLINIDAQSRKEVDEMAQRVLKAGGKIYAEPAESQGWMYGFGFEDLDGHRWNMLYMDVSKMPHNQKPATTVATFVKAPVDKVWESFTSPEHIVHWNHASDDWECPHAENDLRIGGRFLSRMAAKDGTSAFDFSGMYFKVDKERELSYTLDDGRVVSVTLVENEGGVKLTVTFELEEENSEELQKKGWQAILDNFRKYAETNAL